MHDVVVANRQWVLNNNISVDVGLVIVRISLQDRSVLCIDQIKGTVHRTLEPVVTNDESGRTIFQTVTIAPGSYLTKAIVLEGDSLRFSVVVVFCLAAGISVIVDVIPLDEHIAGRGRIV